MSARDAAGRTFRTVSDDRGRYRIAGLHPGLVEVTVTRIGYRTHRLEVRLPPGGTLSLNVELAAHPIVLPPLLVERPRDPEARPGRADSTGIPAGVEGVALAVEGVAGAPGLVESLPGLRTIPGDGSGSQVGGLYARSARADPGLVLLEGAPVRTPFSLTGLLGNLDATLFPSASLFEGGAPARLDGGLSQILELRTRRPGREVRARASLDGLAASAQVEGGLWGGATVLVASRGLHDEGSRLAGRGPLPVGYGEGLVRLESDLGASTFAVTAFRNRERTRLETAEVDPSAGPGDEVDPPEATWGNTVVVGRWRGHVGGVDTRTVASWSRYDARVSRSEFGAAQADRARTTVEVSTFERSSIEVVGVSAEWIRHRASAGDGATGARARTWTVSGFVQGAVGSDPLGVSWGVRADHFSPGGTRLALRGRLRWRPLGSGTVFSLGLGRFHQVGTDLADGPAFELSRPEVSRLVPEGVDGGGSLEMTVASADHVVAGLDQTIGEDVAVSTRLHFKSYRDLPGVGSDRLASSGTEVRFGWTSGARSLGIGYGLTWTWERDGDAPRFDERHLLTASGTTPLLGSMELRLGLSWGDGLPLASIRLDPPDVPEEPGQAPPPIPLEDDFLRLDVELSGLWCRQAWRREVRLRPYLRLLNGLASRDNLFRYVGPAATGGTRGVESLAILPVLGLEVAF